MEDNNFDAYCCFRLPDAARLVSVVVYENLSGIFRILLNTANAVSFKEISFKSQ